MTFHKYPKIKLVGNEENKGIFDDPNDDIVIEEKVDGANFRFMLSEGKIVFGSRMNALGTEDNDIGGNWKRCVEFIKKQVNKKSLGGEFPIIVYGECMVQHSVAYDWERVPPFLGFDIMDLVLGKFVQDDVKQVYFKELNLPTVPHIKIVKASELKTMKWDDSIVPKSVYYSGQAEGIVMKNYQKQLMAKWVTTKFKEVNKATFGGGKKFAKDDSEKIVAMYCTNARIDKCIFKLIDSGEKLDLAMMHKLPQSVMDDIYEEHWKDICYSTLSINFRDVKKQISFRCLQVLKQVIANNALVK